MSALRFVAWGLIELPDFPFNDDDEARVRGLIADANKELKPHRIHIHWGQFTFAQVFLLGDNNKWRGLSPMGIRGAFQRALHLIEPKDHQNEQAS